MSGCKRCLFGGALLAAGITGQAAASAFDWDYASYPMRQYGYVYNFNYGVTFSHDYDHPGGPYTTQPYTTFATTEISSTRLHAEYGSFVYVAGAFAYGYFTVASQCDVTISWDFTATTNDPIIQLYDITDGATVFGMNTGSGAELETVYPGHLYYALVDAGVGAQGLEAFGTIEVPAPGMGLLAGTGIGLGALRRRRRE